MNDGRPEGGAFRRHNDAPMSPLIMQILFSSIAGVVGALILLAMILGLIKLTGIEVKRRTSRFEAGMIASVGAVVFGLGVMTSGSDDEIGLGAGLLMLGLLAGLRVASRRAR